MEESSPRVDPDVEKVRKTGKRILTSAFRRFYLQQKLDQIPWKRFSLAWNYFLAFSQLPSPLLY